MVSRSHQTHQLLLSVFWLILYILLLLLFFCFHLTYLAFLYWLHHVFSHLPTASYSATTDLNTDLALSVPLRQEREIPYLQLLPTML